MCTTTVAAADSANGRHVRFMYGVGVQMHIGALVNINPFRRRVAAAAAYIVDQGIM